MPDRFFQSPAAVAHDHACFDRHSAVRQSLLTASFR